MGPQPMADRPSESIASDIFKLRTIVDDVEGKVDGVLLTTCRLTGHISAFPILEEGITAEKAGTIISRRAMWGSFGPRKVIFSDNGPQYAARVAKTMCAQLGVTQMKGQAYRSQSNGKAESSGKVLMDELRSILCSSKKAGPRGQICCPEPCTGTTREWIQRPDTRSMKRCSVDRWAIPVRN